MCCWLSRCWCCCSTLLLHQQQHSLGLQCCVYEVAVQQHLEGLPEAVVDLVEANRAPGVLVLLAAHGAAAVLVAEW